MITSQNEPLRNARVRLLLESRLAIGRTDTRWDVYTPEILVREAQCELLDAILYLERLREKLEERWSRKLVRGMALILRIIRRPFAP